MMRVELALIVGIICFCCWCAFILVKMGYSTQNPSSPQANSPAVSHLQTIGSPYGAPNYGQMSNGRLESAYQGIEASPKHPVFAAGQRPGEASAPAPTYHMPGAYGSPISQPTGSQQLMWTPAANQLYRPEAGYLSQSSNRWPVQVRNGSRFYAGFPDHPKLSWGAESARVAETEPGQDQESAVEADQEEQSAEPVGVNEPESEGSEDESGQQVDSTGDKSVADEEPEQPPEEELTERSGGRSYSEDSTESQERDKEGRPIIVHRRHLINGKPVKVKAGSPVRTKTRKAPGKAKDFDALVSEIEATEDQPGAEGEYDESAEASHQSARQPNQPSNKNSFSRRSSVANEPTKDKTTILGVQRSKSPQAIGETGLFSSKTDRKPRDSHQHRLTESLTAQQWDDDSNGDNGVSPKEKAANQAASQQLERRLAQNDHDDQLNGENRDEPEESAMNDDSDPFSNSGEQFIFGTDSRKRRKRQINRPIDEPSDLKSADDLSLEVQIPGQHEPSSDNIMKTSHPGELGWPPQQLNSMQVAASPQFQPQSSPSVGVPVGASYHGGGQPGFSQSNGHSGGPGPEFGQQRILVPQLPYIEPAGANQYPYPIQPNNTIQTEAPAIIWPQNQQPNYQYVNYHPTGLLQPSAIGARNYPLASDISTRMKKKKKHKKFKESAISDSKHKAAKAHQMHRASKFKKGGSKKKKKASKKKMSKKSKEFKASTSGMKGQKGDGHHGAKKGALYVNDKGYKKRGFKKAYKKLEAGDHKTYFDEFRDRDHNKRWKNYKDKHSYSNHKKWAGKDSKKYNNSKMKESKQRKSHSDGWRSKAGSKFRNDYVEKEGSQSARKKKKKKSFTEDENDHYM